MPGLAGGDIIAAVYRIAGNAADPMIGKRPALA
jgi:hypothetical protein